MYKYYKKSCLFHTMHLSVAWGATLAICGFLSALPGLAIQQIFPEITAGNQFTPIFIVTYLPAVVRGLMLAGLLGLMLTSGDSYLLLLASTVTDDVVVPIKKDMDEKKKKLIYKKIRFWVIILILIALIGGTSGYKKQKIKRLKNMLNQMLKYQ